MRNKNKYDLKTEEQALRYFIERMDIEMVAAFINKTQSYQDMEVSLFLSKLDALFDRFKACGDEYLLAYKGNCGVCYKDKKGYVFVGNNSFNYVNLIIDEQKGLVKDIFECSSFRTKAPIFLKRKLYLDNDKIRIPF